MFVVFYSWLLICFAFRLLCFVITLGLRFVGSYGFAFGFVCFLMNGICLIYDYCFGTLWMIARIALSIALSLMFQCLVDLCLCLFVFCFMGLSYFWYITYFGCGFALGVLYILVIFGYFGIGFFDLDCCLMDWLLGVLICFEGFDLQLFV